MCCIWQLKSGASTFQQHTLRDANVTCKSVKPFRNSFTLSLSASTGSVYCEPWLCPGTLGLPCSVLSLVYLVVATERNAQVQHEGNKYAANPALVADVPVADDANKTIISQHSKEHSLDCTSCCLSCLK